MTLHDSVSMVLVARYMAPHNMAKNEIAGITQASKYLAGYAGEEEGSNHTLPVICWSVMKYTGTKDPDEVVGQVWDGNTITEAPSIEEAGEFVGYFTDDDEGRAALLEACDTWREDSYEEEEDEVD